MACCTTLMEFEQGWDFIQSRIEKMKRILEGFPEETLDAEQRMHIYTTIFNMCVQKIPDNNYAERLYDKYRETFEVYMDSTVLPSLREKHDEFLLREFVLRWTNHKLMVRWLSRLFSYLDRFHIPRQALESLAEVGQICFHDMVYSELKGMVKDAGLAIINKEREGEQVDRSLLKNVVDVFVEVSMGKMVGYKEDFEKHMIEDAGFYFSRKASSWILELSCPDYMRRAEECLKKERKRVSSYLQSSTEPKLVERVQHELLVLYQTQLLEKEGSGCLALLVADKVEDLCRMFQLYHKIPKGLEPVAAIFGKHVTQQGIAFIQQAEEASTANQSGGGAVQEQVLVGKIIELHDKCLGYVTDSFQNHKLFQKALKEAFEVFCNKNVAGTSSAELLAAFCESLLKKKGGSEKLSDEAIEDKLDKLVKLLAYVHEKDLFVEFYRKKLARRLLFDRSSNDDLERSVLTKLKQQFGAHVTSKMEGMMTDLTLARENQNKFDEFLANNPNFDPKIDFSVTLLTTGFWPTYKSSDIILPKEMVKCVNAFTVFQEATTSHRKLTWIYSLGSAQVLGRFDRKPIELVVSTYQAAVLLLFNSSVRLSFSEISTQLNLSAEDLIRLLHSLSCGKHKILNKEPDTKTISSSDFFEFNSKFTEKMRRIRIPLPIVDEGKKVVEDVNRERPYAIDAAIIRIMKSRKVLNYQQLVSMTVEHLSKTFKPDIKSIKKRTEDLIMREFLERDSENSTVLRYLA